MQTKSLPEKQVNPTIGIITALPKEYAAVKAMIEKQKEGWIPGKGAGRRYLLGKVPAANGGKHSVVLSRAGMGTNIAATRATLLLEHFPRVKFIVMVGIAGGVPHPEKPDKHVRLGDIVVSDDGGVIQYGFVTDESAKKKPKIIPKHPPRPPSSVLLEAVDLLEASRLEGKKPWLEFIPLALHLENAKRPSEETDVLTNSDDPDQVIEHPIDPKRTLGQPRVFYGPIASSNTLLKNPKLRDKLRAQYGVKAVEMEASGIADATWNHEAGYLVVRGICDYCDPGKNDVWQGYAAVVAAAYTRALLESIPGQTFDAGSVREVYVPPLSDLHGSSESTEIDPNITVKPNPFIYGRPVRSEEFVDRENELRTIFNRLRNGESTAISGNQRLGKSSLLLQLSDKSTQRVYLGNDAQRFMMFPLDLHAVSSDYTPTAFWEEALNSLRNLSSDAAITLLLEYATQNGYTRRSLKQVFDYLDSRGKRLVLLLDGMHRLLVHPNFRDSSFFALLRSLSTLTGGLALVTASYVSVSKMNQQVQNLQGTGSPVFDHMIEIPLHPFGEDAVNVLFERVGETLSPDDQRFARRVAGRQPFLLQAMAAALVETTDSDRQACAVERFYEQISSYFEDLWRILDNRTRTTVVVLSLIEMSIRALGQDFDYSAMEQFDAFGIELGRLAKLALAEQAGDDWQFDRQCLCSWRGERWTMGTQAFVWWMRDVVVIESHRSPIYDEWLTNKCYQFLLTQKEWNDLVKTLRNAREWTMRTVGMLGRDLFEELAGREER